MSRHAVKTKNKQKQRNKFKIESKFANVDVLNFVKRFKKKQKKTLLDKNDNKLKPPTTFHIYGT
jgi:hypothetical protein